MVPLTLLGAALPLVRNDSTNLIVAQNGCILSIFQVSTLQERIAKDATYLTLCLPKAVPEK